MNLLKMTSNKFNFKTSNYRIEEPQVRLEDKMKSSKAFMKRVWKAKSRVTTKPQFSNRSTSRTQDKIQGIAF